MHTPRFPHSHLIPSNLKCSYFPLAFLVSIFSFYLPSNFVLNTLSQGSGIRSNVLCILFWSWRVHCHPEAFPGLLNLGHVHKNYLLHIPLALSRVLHLPGYWWLSCWKQPAEKGGGGGGGSVARASPMKTSAVLCPKRVQFIGSVGLIQSLTNRSYVFLAV